MNPQEHVCHNPQCWVYGRVGEGHIVIHSQREQRYRCKRCAQTFSATKDTPFYRLHHPQALMIVVATLARLWLSGAGDCRRFRIG